MSEDSFRTHPDAAEAKTGTSHHLLAHAVPSAHDQFVCS